LAITTKSYFSTFSFQAKNGSTITKNLKMNGFCDGKHCKLCDFSTQTLNFGRPFLAEPFFLPP
jgi:hypothetical protein